MSPHSTTPRSLLRMPVKQKMAVSLKSLMSSVLGGGKTSTPAYDELFEKTDPQKDGEECLHDCDGCTVRYPRGFKIDEEDVLYGQVKGWSTHVLVGTGKTDWVRDVGDEKGSVMEAISKADGPTNGVSILYLCCLFAVVRVMRCPGGRGFIIPISWILRSHGSMDVEASENRLHVFTTERDIISLIVCLFFYETVMANASCRDSCFRHQICPHHTTQATTQNPQLFSCSLPSPSWKTSTQPMSLLSSPSSSTRHRQPCHPSQRLPSPSRYPVWTLMCPSWKQKPALTAPSF